MDGEIRLLVGHLSPTRKQSVKQALRSIAANPYQGKPLREDLAGYYSYRIGILRVVYSIDGFRKTIHVVALGPRRTIYEDLERDLKKRRTL